MAAAEEHLGSHGKKVLGIGGLALLGIVARGVVNHLSGKDALEKVKIFGGTVSAMFTRLAEEATDTDTTRESSLARTEIPGQLQLPFGSPPASHDQPATSEPQTPSA